MSYRLGILASHPIQYYAPWFRQLAHWMDIEVFYAYRQDPTGQSQAGFGIEFEWDTPLLDGYQYQWLTNVASTPNLQSFLGCDTPEISDIVRRGRFDAFMIFGWNHKSNWQTIMACRRQGVPVLMRGDSQLVTHRSKLTLAVKYIPYRWFLPKFDAHLYVGQRNKEYLQFYSVPEARLIFVPHVVDNAFFAERAHEARMDGRTIEIRKQYGIPSDAFVVVWVGKFIAKKRPADFVQAMAVVIHSNAGGEVHALMVGDGPLRPEVQRMATNQPGRIHFAGFQNQNELPSYYAASDALVLSSDGAETWGLVVNEAMASGIPAIVSHEAGCAPDLIDEGQTGLTYPTGDIGALARCVLKLEELCKRQPDETRVALTKKMSTYSIDYATRSLQNALVTAGSESIRSARPVANP